MKISEKLKAFQERRLEAREAAPEDMVDLSIGNKAAANLILAEPHASLQANPICKPGEIFFGAHSYMNAGGYLRDGVFVGRYTSIGRRVTIAAEHHGMNGLTTSPALGHPQKPHPYSLEDLAHLNLPWERDNRLTAIMNDVWIGDGVVVMRGVTIGTGAVIGANSVVTRDVPPYAIFTGAPARLIRYRFPEDVIAELLASEWWEMERDILKGLPFDNIIATLRALQLLKEQGMPDCAGAPWATIETWRTRQEAAG